jgi:quercetin dioxygenase-like cupin family protein
MRDEITELSTAGEELLATARESSDGRASRTVVHGDRMRSVLMALVNGTGLQEHDAPPAATFQVVSGRARLIAGDRTWEVAAGGVVPIPQERHSVETDEDAVILLTVALD